MQANPPQTELHRHLDISVRPATLLELLQQRGLQAQSTSLAAFSEWLILREPLADLGAVLEKFEVFQKIYDRPEVFERVGFEVVEDCWREGTRQVELRFSPAFACQESGLGWEDALSGFEAGIARAMRAYPGMRAGLLCIASRDFGTEGAERTTDFFLKNKNRFLGLDLAGNEALFPIRLFREPFRRAKAEGARITVHAGETSGPEEIWAAIEELGAERIGHGVSSIRDPRLMAFLSKNAICLELCPTSNRLTRAVDRIKDHPLPALLRAGVPVTINTDDPGMFGVSLPDELRLCREVLGMSEAEIQETMAHADRSSFLHASGLHASGLHASGPHASGAVPQN
jgi:adenosine deaminase